MERCPDAGADADSSSAQDDATADAADALDAPDAPDAPDAADAADALDDSPSQ